MQLIGVNRSPFTRRVAITLHVYGISFQQRSLSGFGDREAVRALNPLGPHSDAGARPRGSAARQQCHR